MADIVVRNNLDLSGQKVKNAADATAGDEYVTLSQAESLFRGINRYFTAEARATGNVDISQLNAGDALDGVTLATGDTVLLDQQTTASQDGLYTVGATAGTSVRLDDFDTGSAAEGVAVTVTGGSTHGDKLFVQTVEDAVVGTDGLTFTQIGAGGASGGAGMTSGFDIQAADTSITVGTDDIAVNLAGSGGLEVSSGVKVKLDGATLTLGASGLKVTTPVDSSVPRKFSTSTHASSTSITITHNLGTEDVVVSVRLASGAKSAILVDWDPSSTNDIVLRPAVAPSANTWTVTVIG